MSKACGEADHEAVVKAFKASYPNLFSGKMGCIKNFEVDLDVDQDARPVRQAQRPVPFHLHEAVEKELMHQVEQGILERVDETSGPTPWVSNLVVVPKDKNARNAKTSTSSPQNLGEQYTLEVRLTCDCKAFNKELRRTKYPCRTLEDLVVQVNGAVRLTKIDIMKAFHQMMLSPASRRYTVITTHIGLFRYKRMHMGISGASETFTEYIRVLLQHCPGQINMTDDILVYGKTNEEHHENLTRVLETLEKAGITLNVAKCEFYRKELTFFGLRFSKFGIAPTEDRCQALQDAKEPRDAKELRSLLGVIQYSGRFIRDLSSEAASLWQLVKPNAEWKWSTVEQAAFNKIKTLISTKCLAYFDKTWLTEVIVDASPHGLGAVLVQVNPNDKNDRKIVCFASRLLTEIETRYSQCEKEGIAAVWGCERFWMYLFGSSFTLVTDNRAIQLIFGNAASRPPARIERWGLRLTQFDFRIVHRPGATNIAHYFSRHPSESASTMAREGQERTELFINQLVENALPVAITRGQRTNRIDQLHGNWQQKRPANLIQARFRRD